MVVNLGVALRVTEQASRPLRRASDAANGMAESANKMSSQLRAANSALLGVAIAVDASIGLMAARAATLEQSVARLETVTRRVGSKTVPQSLADSEDAARKFSTQFTASADEVIRAQFQIATAGIGVSEQIEATQASFKLARATMGEFTQSAQLLGSFLNTFGRSAEFSYLGPAEKMEAITDRLSASVQRFQVTLPVLAESFKFIVGPASQLNLKLAEVSAAIGVLNTAGFRGTLAGTALSNMFNKLDRAVDKLNLNPDKFIDLNGNLKDLVSFLTEVNRALADKTPIEAQNALIDTFDIRAGRVAKTLLLNIDAIRRFSAELEISRGVTERMANTVEMTTSASFKKFGNALNNIATQMGKSFNQALMPAIKLLTQMANGFSAILEATGPLIPAVILLGATMITIGIGGKIIVTTFILMKAAIVALTTATWAANTALAIFHLLIGTGVAALIIAGVVALGAAFWFAGKAIWNYVTGADAGKLSIEQITKQAKSGSQAVASFASELTRLNAAASAEVKRAGPSGADLGDSPISDEVERLLKTNVEFDKAVKMAFKTTGGFTGQLRHMAEIMGVSNKEMQKLGSEFLTLGNRTDRLFKEMDGLAKNAEFSKVAIQGLDAAARQMGGGTTEAGNAVKDVAANFEQLQLAIAKGASGVDDKIIERLFGNFAGNLDNLRNTSQKGIQEIVAIFDKAAVAGEEIDFNHQPFRDALGSLEGINSQLNNSSLSADRLIINMTAVKTAAQQTNRATKTVNNIMKNASLGGASFARSISQAKIEIDNSNTSLAAFLETSKGIENNFKQLTRGLENTAEFKELEKQIEKRRQIEVELRVQINEAEAAIQASKIFLAVEREGKLSGERQKKQVERLGGVFAKTIGNALSGGLKRDNKNVFAELARDFRTEFTNKIASDISTVIGAKFRKSFEGVRALTENFVSGLTGQQLLEGLESGDLARILNEKLAAAVPGLDKFLGGDLFDSGAIDKLSEKFKGIGTDAAVGLVTAGNRSAAIIRQLQTVLSTGPADTLMGLNDQATKLRNLIREASNTGAPGAIRFAENALKAVLDRMQQLQTANSPNSLAAQAKQGAAALGASAQSMRDAIATLVPQGQKFVSLMGDAFGKLNGSTLGISDSPKKIEITLNSGTKRFEFAIDKDTAGVNTEDGVDEDELRKIMDELKIQMDEERDEIIRNLEDELRNR